MERGNDPGGKGKGDEFAHEGVVSRAEATWSIHR
jgi:hypothetical protein